MLSEKHKIPYNQHTMLSIGIIGLPNVGKSTLFRALTKKQVPAENYPFVTIDPNIGVVEVPDERVERLSELSRSKKKIRAAVEFVDIAGLVKGAHAGAGLGNTFLSHIKETDAVAEVVRVFEDPRTIHVEGAPDPVRDIEILDLELILKDLDTVKGRDEGLQKRIRMGDKAAQLQKELLDCLFAGLEKGLRAEDILQSSSFDLSQNECKTFLSELSLLTAKPRIFVFNGSEEQIKNGWQPDGMLTKAIAGDPWILLSAKTEDDLNELLPGEQKEYLTALGINRSGLDQLIALAYKTLGLITFLTTGEDETRAWTILCGSSAPKAGRAIHSDFEEKFIRAEIIHYEKLVEAGSFARARELGWMRIEGKNYIVQDGDVVEFKI